MMVAHLPLALGVTMDEARLKSIPVFAGLDDEALHHVAALASEVTVPADKQLVREGDYSYEMLAIVEGTARVEQGGEAVAELGPGDVIGEMGVIGRSQRNATVTATSPMSLITLDHWDFAKLRKSVPEIVDRLTALIDARRSG
jgi:CRP-like cAMP-binding protein